MHENIDVPPVCMRTIYKTMLQDNETEQNLIPAGWDEVKAEFQAKAQRNVANEKPRNFTANWDSGRHNPTVECKVTGSLRPSTSEVGTARTVFPFFLGFISTIISRDKKVLSI